MSVAEGKVVRLKLAKVHGNQGDCDGCVIEGCQGMEPSDVLYCGTGEQRLVWVRDE